MSYFPPYDFHLAIARGVVPGHSLVVIRGHNPDIDSASGFVDLAEMGNLTYLASAETMNIVSTSTDDAAAGTGLRTVLVQGVDNTGALLQEQIILNGTTNVLTVGSYLRVNFLIALTVGSGEFNAGDITATASSAGTIQTEMDAEEGFSQGSHYTVPLGKKMYVKQAELNVAKTGGGLSPVVEFKAIARAGVGNAWLQFFDKKVDVSVADELDVTLAFPSKLVARTDLRFRAETDRNNTEVRVRLYGVLVDD